MNTMRPLASRASNPSSLSSLAHTPQLQLSDPNASDPESLIRRNGTVARKSSSPRKKTSKHGPPTPLPHHATGTDRVDDLRSRSVR